MKAVTSIIGLCAAVAIAAQSPSHQHHVRDTSGCGKSHDDKDSTFSRSLDSGGVKRSYSIHLPSNYSPEHSHPVVLGFHGSGSIGLFFEADTRFSDAAEKAAEAVIMVYPDGLGGAWAGANYSEATVPQDLQFVLDLLEDLRDDFCVDNQRIFATGMSIGGGFVDTIACNETVGKEFAGFAPVAGAYYTDNDENHKRCKPSKPVYLFSFHGEEDSSVPYEGGDGSGGKLPPIEDWIERWADRLDCDEPPYVDSDLFKNLRANWTVWNCDQQGRLGLLSMEGRNHSWPSNEPNFSQNIAGDDPAPFDAATWILNFFLQPQWRDPDGSHDDEGGPIPTWTTSPEETTSATGSESTSASAAQTTTTSDEAPASTTESTPDAAVGLHINLAILVLLFLLQLSLGI